MSFEINGKKYVFFVGRDGILDKVPRAECRAFSLFWTNDVGLKTKTTVSGVQRAGSLIFDYPDHSGQIGHFPFLARHGGELMHVASFGILITCLHVAFDFLEGREPREMDAGVSGKQCRDLRILPEPRLFLRSLSISTLLIWIDNQYYPC
jgi:hypothetical protein